MVVTYQMKRSLPLSLLIVVALTTAGCAATPALHVIGVYEGQPLPDADPHAEKQVAVDVSDDSRPIVLALTAYDRTLWKVSLKQGVKLVKVVLGGYLSQRVSGIPPETRIETYTYEPSPCERCWQGAEYFYSYQSPPEQLKKITGLKPASFQGRYQGAEFSISPGMKKFRR